MQKIDGERKVEKDRVYKKKSECYIEERKMCQKGNNNNKKQTNILKYSKI